MNLDGDGCGPPQLKLNRRSLPRNLGFDHAWKSRGERLEISEDKWFQAIAFAIPNPIGIDQEALIRIIGKVSSR